MKHIEELDMEINDLNKVICELRGENLRLQNEINLMQQNKGNFSDVFMLTNQHHQELFDQLRERLAQKEAQIADLQKILHNQREEASR